MILKHKPDDFRVMEVLKPGLLGEGPYRLYRLTKKKRTTLEAVDWMAGEAGVEKKDISMAGLKDKQGITSQYISVKGGREISLHSPDLKISLEGYSAQPMSSDLISGNLFDITVRDLSGHQLDAFRVHLEEVKRFGLPNYFDDQRFGCVRHGQGFILRDVLRGDLETALKSCLASVSPFDSPEEAAWKSLVRRRWGDWEACAGAAQGRTYPTLFIYLKKNPKDFKGAFRWIPARVRLIHLYAYQSYLWNKCVSLYLSQKVGENPHLWLPCDIGPLFVPRTLGPAAAQEFHNGSFPLIDSHTSPSDPQKKNATDAVLRKEGFSLRQFRIEDLPGFIFKGEERALFFSPAYVRTKPPAKDEEFRGRMKLQMRFTLPSGSYATLVLKRLFAEAHGEKVRTRRESVS